ncbi:DNA adenine methylase [Caulobacter sp. 1776]
MRPVHPVRPVAPYIGGKRNLAKRLVALIETFPHLTYAEPFVGMGGIFLRRGLKPQAEVINDWSRDVSNFYRILQVHFVAFLDMLRFQITTRAEFERLVAVDPDTLTDLQRAARFLYLQRTAFGGKVDGRNFGVSRHRPGRIDVTRLQGELEALHERMAAVTVERLPWRAFVERYDTAHTLFYLDPPYYGCEDDYGAGMFARSEFEEMAQVLGRLQGRFVLSINDRPEVREIFSAFNFDQADVTYSVSGGPTNAKELIITGRSR